MTAILERPSGLNSVNGELQKLSVRSNVNQWVLFDRRALSDDVVYSVIFFSFSLSMFKNRVCKEAIIIL